jgi:hypothetical protein
LAREIPEHSIPCVLGGKFIPNNVLYDFDLSENGPFYYPGCPVCREESESGGISENIKSDLTTPEQIHTPTDTEMEILKSDDEAVDIENCEETKIERDFIDFNDSACTSAANSEKNSVKKPPRKVVASSPAVDKTEFNSRARKSENNCGNFFGKKEKEKEKEKERLHDNNSDAQTTPKSDKAKGLLGELRGAEFSKRINEKDLVYRAYHKMKNTGNILGDQLGRDAHIGRISHILKIENMSKIGNSFNEARSRRDGGKKIGYGRTTQKKTNSGSRRCTDVQSMAQERNCRATCSIQ